MSGRDYAADAMIPVRGARWRAAGERSKIGDPAGTGSDTESKETR